MEAKQFPTQTSVVLLPEYLIIQQLGSEPVCTRFHCLLPNTHVLARYCLKLQRYSISLFLRYNIIINPQYLFSFMLYFHHPYLQTHEG